MKKILLYIALVMVSVSSCLKFEDADSLAPSTTNAPTVAVSAVGDSTFTVTVTPASGTGFYAYAVLEGAPKKVSASTLLTVKAGSGIAEGLVDIKNVPSVSFTLKGLKPNTKYTVYAAANSEQGQTTEVATAEAQTNDGVAPFIKQVSVGKVGQIQFSEPVVLGKKGAKAWVTYYKLYNAEDSVTMEIPAKNMLVQGSVLQLTPPKHIPGAYTIYTYEAGIVTDLVGQDCPAQKTQKFEVHTDIFESDSLSVKGVAGRIPTENWDLVWKQDNKDGDTTIYFSNPAQVQFTFETPVIATVDNQGYNMVKSGVAMSYFNDYYGESNSFGISRYQYTINPEDSTFSFSLPLDIDMFTFVDFGVAEGTFTDEYGNKNSEFSRSQALRYIPCVSNGVDGIYQLVGYTNNNFEVKVINDTTAYIYGLCAGIPNSHPLKAEYNKKEATLTVDFDQPYYVVDGVYNIGFYGWNITRLYPQYEGDIDLDGSITFDILDNGWLDSDDMYILADLPASDDEDPEYRFEDVPVYALGQLNVAYGIVKISNFNNILGAETSVPANYVEKIEPIGTLADMPALLSKQNNK